MTTPFQADLARYPRRPWLREQSIWAIALYRFGRWNDARRPGPSRWLCDKLYWALYRPLETLTGITIEKATQIGPGLRIWHFGGIVVHHAARLGSHCTLRQGVTIGNRSDGGPVPILEDNVELGAYAQILGGVRIGSGAKIGAMSVVLQDVPAGATAVGNPARVIINVDMDPLETDATPEPVCQAPAATRRSLFKAGGCRLQEHSTRMNTNEHK